MADETVNRTRPGAPGIAPTWTSSAKDMVVDRARLEPPLGDASATASSTRSTGPRPGQPQIARPRLHHQRPEGLDRGQARRPLSAQHAQGLRAAAQGRARGRRLSAGARIPAASAARRLADPLSPRWRRPQPLRAGGAAHGRRPRGQFRLGRRRPGGAARRRGALPAGRRRLQRAPAPAMSALPTAGRISTSTAQ